MAKKAPAAPLNLSKLIILRAVANHFDELGSFHLPLIDTEGEARSTALATDISTAMSKLAAVGDGTLFLLFCDELEAKLLNVGIRTRAPRVGLKSGSVGTIGTLVNRLYQAMY